MPKKGHTEEQIIAALKQQEAGEKTSDICRKLGEPGDVVSVEAAVRRVGAGAARAAATA